MALVRGALVRRVGGRRLSGFRGAKGALHPVGRISPAGRRCPGSRSLRSRRVGNAFGKRVENDDSGHDEHNARHGRKVEGSALEHPGHERDQSDADPGPDGVGDPDRNSLEGEREETEGCCIAYDNDNRRPQAGKTFRRRGLQTNAIPPGELFRPPAEPWRCPSVFSSDLDHIAFAEAARCECCFPRRLYRFR